eukprot:5444233-Amphidinium_carterae.1
MEKDAHKASGSGDNPRRRKFKKDEKSWRRDTQQRRTNGWDSKWCPSLSCKNSEKKYVPIKEEGFFDKRDMAPVKRTSTA